MPFEILRIDRHLRVGSDYHVRFLGNFYSVPYTFANSYVDVITKKKVAEFFIDGARIASHILREANSGESVTTKSHLPSHHKDVRFSGKEHRLEAAGNIGPNCQKVAEKIFEHSQHEEVALRRCRHLTSLVKHFGENPLEKICALALSMDVVLPEDIEMMLKLRLDVEPDAATKGPNRGSAADSHVNLRGKPAFTLGKINEGDENDRADGA